MEMLSLFLPVGTVSYTHLIEHIQKAPLIFTGLKQRDNNIPIEKGNNIRSNPPTKLTLSLIHI